MTKELHINVTNELIPWSIFYIVTIEIWYIYERDFISIITFIN